MIFATHAADVMHLMGPGRNPSIQVLPGLPRISSSPFIKRSPNIGATKTVIGAAPPPFVDVSGQPSMKIVPAGRQGVITVLDRHSRYADMVSDEDMTPLYRLIEQVEAEAVKLSQGPLSLQELRRRNHPYGRGLLHGRLRGRIARSGRAGVPSLAVINRQSGELAGSWDSELRRYKGGVRLILKNTAEYSKYLALGTSRMKAHGPFAAAMVKYLPQINAAWSAAAKRAYLREMASQQLSQQLGGDF